MIRNSIRGRLMTFLVITILVPITCSIIISFQYTKNALKKDTIRENIKMMSQGKTNINSYLDMINNVSLQAYNNLQESRSLYGYLSSPQTYVSDKDIYFVLNNILQSSQGVQQIFLQSDHLPSDFLLTGGMLKRAPRNEAVLTEHLLVPKNKTEPYVEPAHLLHDYGTKGYPYSPRIPVLTVHRPIYSAPLQRELGILSIDFNLETITNLLDMFYEDGNEEFYFMGNNDQVVYSSKTQLVGSRLNEQWLSRIQRSPVSEGYWEWKRDGFRGIILFDKFNKFNQEWILVKRIPDTYLYENAKRTLLINSLVLSLFLVVVLIAAMFISVKLTNPIKELTKSIRKINLQKLNLQIDQKGTDEIGVLAGTIQSMVSTIDNLFMKELRLEIANKDNQLRALQAQINPHFIYNALQSIGAEALENDVPLIYSLATSLGKMMRYNMNTHDSVVILQREVQHIEAYIEIQQQRFKDKLRYDLHTDPAALRIHLPKMILQPIVENCFKHGFNDQSKVFEVTITIGKTNPTEVIILIADNGAGMPMERINEMNRFMKEANDCAISERIGLFNVFTRLQLFFSGEAKMRLMPRHPVGLFVEIRIPCRLEEPENESPHC